MTNICVHAMGKTAAFATIGAFVEAYKDGKNYVTTADYPFLTMSLKQCNILNSYHGLIVKTQRKSDVVGYDLRVDLQGNIIKKEPRRKTFTIYTFDPEQVEQMMKDLNNEINVQSILHNIELLQKLLG